MENKTLILILLTIIEAICAFALRNEPYGYVIMAITLALWIITAFQIRKC